MLNSITTVHRPGLSPIALGSPLLLAIPCYTPLPGVVPLIYSLFWSKAILSMVDWRSRLACQFIFFSVRPWLSKSPFFSVVFLSLPPLKSQPEKLTLPVLAGNFEKSAPLLSKASFLQSQSPTFRSQSSLSPNLFLLLNLPKSALSRNRALSNGTKNLLQNKE